MDFGAQFDDMSTTVRADAWDVPGNAGHSERSWHTGCTFN